MTDIVPVHATREGEAAAACGNARPGEPMLTWGQIHDPNRAPFTCGRCLTALADGVEPSMGGSAP